MGAAPADTIGRSGTYLTDSDRRVVVLHGITVPAGVTPTAGDIDTWVGFGFTGVRLAVPMASGGRFPATSGGPVLDGAGAATTPADPGLDQAAALTRMFTDRGLRVTLRIVPSSAGYVPSVAGLAAGLERLATRFRDVPGLLGYEVSDGGGGGAGLVAAVAAHDGAHLLWRERPAPFDAASTVAVNDPTGYLVGWKDGSAVSVRGLVASADAFGLSWFYDVPSPTGGTVGTAAPPVGLGGAERRAPAPPADIVRPYPVAIAGVPEVLRFDASRVLTVAYRTAPSAGPPLAAGTATAISVPAWSYPTGYQVQVTGARVTSAPGAGLLCLVSDPGAARVEVRVSPATGPAVTPPSVAGSAGCRATPAIVPAGGRSPGPDGPRVAASGDDATEEYSGPLLWLLPLVGAALAALLLGALLRPWRRRSGPGPGWSAVERPTMADTSAGGD